MLFMLMRIISSVTTAICLIVAIFLVYKVGSTDKSNQKAFRVYAGPNRVLKWGSLSTIILGFIALVCSCILSFTEEEAQASLITYSLSLPITALGFLVFVVKGSRFVGIKNDRLFVRVLFKTNEYRLDEIVSYEPARYGFFVHLKDGGGFAIQCVSSDLDKILESIDGAREEIHKKPLLDVRQFEKAAIIGQEFRANYASNKKKSLIAVSMYHLLGFVLIAAIGIGLSLASGESRYLLLCLLSLLMLVFIPINVNKTAKEIDAKMKENDLVLGAYVLTKMPFLTKDNGRKWNIIWKASLGFLFFGAVLAGVTNVAVALDDGPLPRESLVAVTGKLEYTDSTSKYFMIGLKDDPIEYRVDSIYRGYFDASIQDKPVGEEVTIWINPDEKEKSNARNGREGWVDAYIVKTESETYLSYEDYAKGHDNNIQIARDIMIAGYSIIGLSAFALAAGFIIYKPSKKKDIGQDIK